MVLWEDFSTLIVPLKYNVFFCTFEIVTCCHSWFSCLSHHQFGLVGMVRLSLGGLGHHQFGTGLGRLFLVWFRHGQFLCVAIVSVISLFLAYRDVPLL